METNVYFGGLEWQGGAGKEPEEARGALSLHQGSDGIDIHICKDIMCRSLHMTTYNLSKWTQNTRSHKQKNLKKYA